MKALKPPLVSDTIKNWLKEKGAILQSFSDIAQLPGYEISTFSTLRSEVSKLAVANSGSILFYRGQSKDYKRDNKTTIMPSLYRGKLSEDKDDVINKPTEKVIASRWEKLKEASSVLLDCLKGIKKISEIKRRKMLQWAILQHYEVVDTPFVDVTQSLRVAASFAMLNNEKETAYIYIFALPYYKNRIYRDSEEELTIMRLLSICPPMAKRPHLQEGFLIGEEDIEIGSGFSECYDLRRRLIAKFKIPNKEDFWDCDSALNKEVLYPTNDDMKNICDDVKNRISN